MPPETDTAQLVATAINGIKDLMASEFRGVRQQIGDLSRRVDERHADLERRVTALEDGHTHWLRQWPSLLMGGVGLLVGVLSATGVI